MTEKQYTDLYNKSREKIYELSPDALNKVREDAFEVFERMGFPTAEQERYRHSQISECFAPDYGMNLNRVSMVGRNQQFRCEVNGLDVYTFFVIGDSFVSNVDDPKYKNLHDLGVVFGSLNKCAVSHSEIVKKYYCQDNIHKSEPIAAFNTAFTQDGFFLYVPDNVVLDKPIQVVYLMNVPFDMLATPRDLIVIGRNAKADVIMCEHCGNEHKYLSTKVTEVTLLDGAHYGHYRFTENGSNSTTISDIYVNQDSNSVAHISDIVLRSSFTRSNIRINLNQPNAETVLSGVCIGDSTDHIDIDTYIDHRAPNCKSTELYKFILDDCSIGSFAGRILVRKDSQKTEAYQSNKNICSKSTAKMYTKPQLEIYADDVKCSHGATVGQIDEEALFYLRSRGIGEQEARTLLILAFSDDIVNKIQIEPLRNRMRSLIERRLRRQDHKCTACNVCTK